METYLQKDNIIDESDNVYEILSRKVKDTDFKISDDCDGNVILRNSGTGKKVLVVFVAPRKYIRVTSVENKCGDNIAKIITNEKNASKTLCGERVFDANKNEIGVIAENKENSSLFIKASKDANIKKGDYVYPNLTVHCEANKLYRHDLAPVICEKIAGNLLKELNNADKQITFTLYSSLASAKAYVNSEKYDCILTVTTAETKDLFGISDGCGIVYKEGSAVVLPKMKECYRKVSREILHQEYFSDKGGIFEYSHIAGKGASVGGIVVPVKNKDEKCEVCDIDDINSAVQMIVNMLGQSV